MSLGDSGEGLACSYLRKRGYRVIDRNYRCRLGEIDIIARRGDTLIFCEVKTRLNREFGEPFEAVTLGKQNRLRRLAQFYLVSHPNDASNFRFDVLSILLADEKPKILHIENAF